MPAWIGTSHFVSMRAAEDYYAEYGDDALDVQRKLEEGQIHIGPPDVPAGGELLLTDGGKRYCIKITGPLMPSGLRVSD